MPDYPAGEMSRSRLERTAGTRSRTNGVSQPTAASAFTQPARHVESRQGTSAEEVRFSLVGVIDGRRVTARYDGALLQCDPLWRERAEHLVLHSAAFASDGLFGPPRDVVATVDGAPLDMLVTLMRCGVTIVTANVELPGLRVVHNLIEPPPHTTA